MTVRGYRMPQSRPRPMPVNATRPVIVGVRMAALGSMVVAVMFLWRSHHHTIY